MIALQVNDLSKSFGDQQVLRHINLSIQEKERVGLVGINGSGKTTLLHCLTGQCEPDSGDVAVASAMSLGCLEQMAEYSPEISAWDAIMGSYSELTGQLQQLRQLEYQMGEPGVDLEKIMEQYARITESYERAGGYACENTARRILIGLGLSKEEMRMQISKFSGGQRTRLNLGRLLALSPDILLLDEPTNHLDLDSVEWLQDFVKNYQGSVLIVSHDRRFLDQAAARILELEAGEVKSYAGNYSEYLKKKAVEDLAQQRAFEKQQLYIQKTEAYIRRFKAGIKSKQARGRQLQLDRLERIQDRYPDRKLRVRNMDINQSSGNEVLDLTGICKSYGGKPLLQDIHLHVNKGEKIALIGPNGCGKTTLLNIIGGVVEADAGEIRLGSRVEIAVFSQEHQDLQPDRTVLDEIVYNFDFTLEEARTALGGMLFSEDEVTKTVRDLSGGELGRVAFLKVILSGANFLLLDEPTNHLDIASCQAVETMLKNYPGTVLVVSHDRYFIDQVADRVVAIEDGRAEYYWGNYSYYYEKHCTKQQQLAAVQKEAVQEAERPKQKQREEEKERLRILRRLHRELEALEDSIFTAENRKTELEALLSNPDTYNADDKVRLYNLEYTQIKANLEDWYQHWEILQEQLAGGQTSP